MTLRIAICDDSPADTGYVKGFVQQWAAQRSTQIHIDTFFSAENFLFQYAENKDVDILLLDVEMGVMDGVTLAKTLRNENDTLQIIFVTGYTDYISEGYEVAALNYLMKPVNADKLFSALDRAVSALQKTEPFILLPTEGEVLRLNTSQVQYVEAFSHTVDVVTVTDTIHVKMSISEMERLLPDGFVRCHRSYLVGLAHIARLSKTEVTLDSGKVLPMSRGASSLVHKAFISYYTGEKDETV